MYQYFTYERGLDNLIWVYSAGVGNKTLEYRKRFYPGSDFVDISGIDIYGVNYKTRDPKYWEYYEIMMQVSPGKPLAMGEGDALPDPDLMASGELPAWLWVLPWWGVPSPKRSVEWARYATQHDFVTSLEELPVLFGTREHSPVIGILSPADDGSARYQVGESARFEVEALDRDGEVVRVGLLVDGVEVSQQAGEGAFVFEWKTALPGFREVVAFAIDDSGRSSYSNSVRVLVGVENAAQGRPARASSGEAPELVVDGSLHSVWRSAPSDPQWIYVDLGAERELEEVVVQWGFRSNGSDFELAVASERPEASGSWKTLHRREDRPYQAWKAVDRIQLNGSSLATSGFKSNVVRVSGGTWGLRWLNSW